MSADQTWVVRGNPTDAEVAAVVVALSAATAAAAAQPDQTGAPAPVNGWSAYWRGVRRPLPTGPGAWRAAGLPS